MVRKELNHLKQYSKHFFHRDGLNSKWYIVYLAIRCIIITIRSDQMQLCMAVSVNKEKCSHYFNFFDSELLQ